MSKVIITLILSVGFLSGCSGLKTYSSDLDRNLRITSKTDSGSILSSVDAAVDIHRIMPDCTTEYAGTVAFDQPTVDIGIPSERSSYLVFVFESSGFLGSTSGMTTYNTLLRPRDGYRYDIEVSYEDNIYNVVISEVSPGNRKRIIEPGELSSCRPL